MQSFSLPEIEGGGGGGWGQNEQFKQTIKIFEKSSTLGWGIRRTKQNIIVVLKEFIPFVRSLRTGQTHKCSHKKDSTINLRYYNSDLIARLQISCTAVISFG